MKDSYSFDLSHEGLDESYQVMYDTYSKIFTRLGINYKVVLADTGAIGGSGSHQFMALSDVGESDIIYCETCGYAADVEKASSKPNLYKTSEEPKEKELVETINKKSIEEVSSYLNLNTKDVVKSMVYRDLANNQLVLAMVRGDREVNEIKLINHLNIAEHELVLASYDDILSIGSVEGFVGPVGLNIKTIVDEEVSLMKNIVVGANKKDYHLLNVNYGRDFSGDVIELRTATEDDLCPICGKPLKKERGIEVGQIFKLGTKYSEPLKCTYQDENGQNKPIVMGCYGIGVTRTMSSIIEQNHDEHGIIWPLNVAPYHAVVVPINYNDEAMKQGSEYIYNKLKEAKVEVILDDRDAKPGFKFKDWELIGIPYVITVGRLAGENVCEFKERKTLEKTEMPYDDAIKKVIEEVNKIK